MEQERPLILISNDDGFDAPGIRALAEMVRGLGDVLVCAPDGARSGFSCAFTASNFLRLRQRESYAGAEVWSATGTPADCVKLAWHKLCTRRPALILGGINHGDNASVNTHYSGTMGVVMEGCMKYVPSVAFSTCDNNFHADLSPLAPYVREIAAHVLRHGLARGVCLNVNFPAGRDFRGVRVCRMGFGRWVDEIDTRKHPYGYDIHFMVGHCENDEPDAEDTDRWALNHHYVAITPTRMDVTDYDTVSALRQQWQTGE